MNIVKELRYRLEVIPLDKKISLLLLAISLALALAGAASKAYADPIGGGVNPR